MSTENGVAVRARSYRNKRGHWGTHAEALCAEVERLQKALDDALETKEAAIITMTSVVHERNLLRGEVVNNPNFGGWFDLISGEFLGIRPKPTRRGDWIPLYHHEPESVYKKALTRLGSMEAFTLSRVINPDADAELLARIDFARNTIADVEIE